MRVVGGGGGGGGVTGPPMCVKYLLGSIRLDVFQCIQYILCVSVYYNLILNIGQGNAIS